MAGADVLVGETVGLFGGEGQHPLGLVGEREIDRRTDLVVERRVTFDLLAE
jgi:hypothetical protein